MSAEIAKKYWDDRYRFGVEHHARQNEQLTKDFSAIVKLYSAFGDVINESLAIEIGCGTGDLCSILTDRHYCAIEGTDLSGLAIEVAKIRFPHLAYHFFQYDILSDPIPGEYEVAIASNVVEHFLDPHLVINKMFELAPRVVIVGPLNQPVTDAYDTEGGAGHVSTLTLGTFSPYRIIAWTTYKSDGWQHSSKGEDPMQFATILEKK